jgi:formyltetrahydrofolate deformylase
MSAADLRLVIICPDRTGIIARVSGFIASLGGSINEASHYSDPVSGMFFMRYVIAGGSLPFGAAGLREAFGPTAAEYRMAWHVTDTAVRNRVVLLVSKLEHCLTDLLYRWKSGDMAYDIPCVISNHEDMRSLVEWHGIPYHCVTVPTDPEGKQRAFEATGELIRAAAPDTVVLARYMQILPSWLCTEYRHRVINIHHSFLPSFVGAKPYHQAFTRGVKLTGATCHYVTEELDAGPIIEQDVIRISHHDAVDTIVRLGKDVERNVLARGLRFHLEDRVLVHDNKTVVFV